MTDDAVPNERLYWVAWSRLPHLGGRRLIAMHDHFGSLEAAWKASARELMRVPGLGPIIAEEAVEARRKLDPAAVYARFARPPVQVVTWVEADYPAPLRELPDPPPVLYYQGTLPRWERAIAIVGTRNASPYGERVARTLARDLAAVGAVIVSGAAVGIDRCAHEGALAVQGALTVGVLGCGFWHLYPSANRDIFRAISANGAVISEYPPDVKANRSHFPYRNRIISGLSRGVIVAEARLDSGSLITANAALEQGREVFAVPGSIFSTGSEGPHDLLRHGARLVARAEDVIEELGWTLKPTKQAPSTDDPTERRLLELLTEGPKHLDELAIQAGLSAAQAGATLIVMQLKGLVRQRSGQHYERL